MGSLDFARNYGHAACKAETRTSSPWMYQDASAKGERDELSSSMGPWTGKAIPLGKDLDLARIAAEPVAKEKRFDLRTSEGTFEVRHPATFPPEERPQVPEPGHSESG